MNNISSKIKESKKKKDQRISPNPKQNKPKNTNTHHIKVLKPVKKGKF